MTFFDLIRELRTELDGGLTSVLTFFDIVIWSASKNLLLEKGRIKIS
jgi:hypothetical protein